MVHPAPLASVDALPVEDQIELVEHISMRMSAVTNVSDAKRPIRDTAGTLRSPSPTNLIVYELTKNGVVEPGRLFEPPYNDHAPIGVGYFFADAQVEVLVDTLHHIKQTAVPEEAA